MGPVAIGVIIGIVVLVLVIVVLNIKIVPQSKAYVIERSAHIRPHGRPASTSRYLSLRKYRRPSPSRSRLWISRPSPLSQRITSRCR